jgi:hypothetical protein
MELTMKFKDTYHVPLVMNFNPIRKITEVDYMREYYFFRIVTDHNEQHFVEHLLDFENTCDVLRNRTFLYGAMEQMMPVTLIMNDFLPQPSG